jgi:flagellar export protein FliJ
MARFRFRLDPVLAHRERIEQDRTRIFAEKQRDLLEAQAQRDALIAERESQRDILKREHKSLTADTLRDTYAHLAYLDRAILEANVRVDACDAEAKAALVNLIEASKEREVLATLKTRRRETHDAEAAHTEQVTLDDQNARQFSRATLQRGNQS